MLDATQGSRTRSAGTVARSAHIAGAAGILLLAVAAPSLFEWADPVLGFPLWGGCALLSGIVLTAVWARARARVAAGAGAQTCAPGRTRAPAPAPAPALPRAPVLPRACGWNALLAAAGILLAEYIAWQLLVAGRSGLWHVPVWIASVTMLGLACAPWGAFAARGYARGAYARVLPALRRARPHALALLVIMVVYCASLFPFLTSWRFAVVGDEYAFFEHAYYVRHHGAVQPFRQDGVYGYHPVLSSVCHAAGMLIFGDNHFGWKMSNVLLMCVAIAGVYTLGLILFGRRAAVAAAALFAASHYLAGQALAGYNNVGALPALVWPMAFYALSARTGQPVWLYMAGAGVGLGLYQNMSARIAAPALLAAALLTTPPRRYAALWPAALGFAAAAFPIMLTARTTLVTDMLGHAVGGYDSGISGPVADRLRHNLLRNLPAFHYNRHTLHYVSGPLLDRASGALAALGAGLSLGGLPRFPFTLCLVWCAVAFLCSGLLSPYPVTAVSRLYTLVAPLSLLAGHALAVLLETFPDRFPRLDRNAALSLLLLLCFGLNVLQTHWHTHRGYVYRPEALAVGALRSEHCAGDAEHILFVGFPEEWLMRAAVRSYAPNRAPGRYVAYADLPAALSDLGAERPDLRCAILAGAYGRAEVRARDDIRAAYPEARFYRYAAPSGQGAILYARLR